MSQHLSIDQLRAMVRPLKNYEGTKIQHVKSKGWYVITGFHFKEDDMTIWFSYETMHTKEPISFMRPVAELLDGRFIF